MMTIAQAQSAVNIAAVRNCRAAAVFDARSTEVDLLENLTMDDGMDPDEDSAVVEARTDRAEALSILRDSESALVAAHSDMDFVMMVAAHSDFASEGMLLDFQDVSV